ncbi:hypothetical protein OTU49_003918 [Cherax quadricarinatus]|uniref:Uncharacterized protein n=1 Tax=Cherax quadricarinatus TaxID=27406 RepID=A0AAW0X1W7_CHEQU
MRHPQNGRRDIENYFSSLKSPTRAPHEGHFGVLPVENGVGGASSSHSSSSSSSSKNGSQRASHYLPPSTPPAGVNGAAATPRRHNPHIYAEPHARPKLGTNGTAHKSSKDSGYYSCEFLDQNPYAGSAKDSGGKVSSSQTSRSLGRHLPPSDSGVFTLSHLYNRPSQYSFNGEQEGIYDNII